jgi:hypothetical protein
MNVEANKACKERHVYSKLTASLQIKFLYEL